MRSSQNESTPSLTQAVTRSATRAEAATETPQSAADVWPRVESVDRAGAAGRLRRVWRLVVSNTGAEPARSVGVRLEPEGSGEHVPTVLGTERVVEILAPGGEAGYELALHMNVAPQARCYVTWVDDAGEHENVATVRFF